jgi:hypothetical protein
MVEQKNYHQFQTGSGIYAVSYTIGIGGCFFVELKGKVSAEWLAFLLRIREAAGSNLGVETDYPDCYSWFSSILQENAVIEPQMKPRTLPSISFPVHSIVCCYGLSYRERR